jgi:hypothetical protein
MFIFFACPKKTIQKKGHPCHLSACGGFPVFLESCREFENSLRSNSSNSYFGSFYGARLRTNGGNRKTLNLAVPPGAETYKSSS